MPSSGITIKLDGLKEASAGLAEFSKATARGIVTRTLKNAVEPGSRDGVRKVGDDFEIACTRFVTGVRITRRSTAPGET